MNESDSEGIGLDALLNSLSNERRRNAILTVASEGMVTKKEIARQISGEGNGPEFDRARISLHQVHLPKLSEMGIVEEVDGAYTLGPNGEEALDALRRLECEQSSNDTQLRNFLRPLVG
jgi:hypothetical protein